MRRETKCGREGKKNGQPIHQNNNIVLYIMCIVYIIAPEQSIDESFRRRRPISIPCGGHGLCVSDFCVVNNVEIIIIIIIYDNNP